LLIVERPLRRDQEISSFERLPLQTKRLPKNLPHVPYEKGKE